MPIRDFLLGLPGASEETPFGPDALVYKVGGKMFALLGWKNQPLTVNLKCDPERAFELRERYSAIKPGYHMNKRHWNTLVLDGSLPRQLVFELARDSFDLIVAKLPRSQRTELER